MKPPTLDYRQPQKPQRDWKRIKRGMMIGFAVSIVFAFLFGIAMATSGATQTAKDRGELFVLALPFLCSAIAAVIADRTARRQ